MHLDFSAFEF